MALSKSFEFIVKKHGAPENSAPLSKERALELRKLLPHSIVDYWLEYGFGVVAGGRFCFCDPDDYRSVLALLFKADKDFNHKEFHIYGYSAFGELYIWSKYYNYSKIDIIELSMSARQYLHSDTIADPDISIGVSLSSLERIDEYDQNDKKLFNRALKKLGMLEPGEVYGFSLAPALGGIKSLDKLKKQPALEHFSMLAQLDDLKLMNFSKFPAEFVRVIG